MRAGILSKRGAIYAPYRTTNSVGQSETSWDFVDHRWCSITPKSGMEASTNKAIVSQTTHEITLRHMNGLTSAHRLVHDGRIFELNKVVADSDNFEMTIEAVELQEHFYSFVASGGVMVAGNGQ